MQVMSNSNTVAENLKRLMRERGLSQPELAKKAGMYQPDISRIANGHIDTKLDKLALALGVELEEFTKPLPKTVEMSLDAFLQTLTPEQLEAFKIAVKGV
jgi:transcriptional regulator with XRE-family HTH domain